ncbi:hypothetical protein pdam_00018400 [Pocillopora damicornis]|uniref:EGF-like domain-containing protein n=1 Tax=Pocillopora damicornis TaxID=46731 RepID=A0A3M6UL05_POCDA|nr:hypothetical protein pdam_00018400 [Pocillopora damicornis]
MWVLSLPLPSSREEMQEKGSTIFLGNLVANVAVKHRLIRPITARYVRFEAKEFLVRICMRIELYGKKVDDLKVESPPVLKRSFLVVPDTRKVFFCNADVVSKSTSPRERNVNYCFYLSRRDSESLMDWIGLGAKILSILGYDTSTKTVYGVGANRKTYVKSPLDLENEVRPLQNRLVYGITKEEWIQARDCNSTILATEIPLIPFHEGAKLPSGSFQHLIIKDKSNNQWGVSSAGLHLNQTLIASWNANERDKCEPNRCKNGGTCVDLYHSFRCECISGYSGSQCQEVFDPCSYPRCYSGASCRTARFMSFVCDCPAGLTGSLCQQAEITTEEVHSNISILTEQSGVANSNNSTMHDGRFTVQINYSRFDIYYDKTSDGTGWILIARFSNSDAKNWVKFSGSWWYDVTEAQGNSIDPSDNADMISPAFWLISGRKFKITRSDDPLHTPLLQTTGDCLEGKYGAVWARRRCQDDCEVNYGWPNETTYGFKQAKCDGPLQSSDKIGFWCDWESGGSVMMVGGGGGTCGGSDHGIGITEKNGGASFHNMEHKFDFGNDANPLNNGTTKNYSLNLWIN